MKINHALTSFYLLTLQSIPEEVVQISRHNIYCTNVLDLLVMKIHYFQNIPMSSKTKKFYSNFMDYRLLNFSNPKYLHFTKKKDFHTQAEIYTLSYNVLASSLLQIKTYMYNNLQMGGRPPPGVPSTFLKK